MSEIKARSDAAASEALQQLTVSTTRAALAMLRLMQHQAFERDIDKSEEFYPAAMDRVLAVLDGDHGCQGLRSSAALSLPSMRNGTDSCSCTIFHSPLSLRKPSVLRNQRSLVSPLIFVPVR
jgi:hypothetical protein